MRRANEENFLVPNVIAEVARQQERAGVASSCNSAAGFILLDASLKPVYANAQAIEILSYPDSRPRESSVEGLLTEKLKSILGNGGASSIFVSDRRRYVCRAFSLDSGSDNSHRPTTAILIERGPRAPIDVAQIAARFHLTQRERETVDLLLHGLTSKEIAQRMRISPNTVKAFLRLVMSKMGVSTRSGILGKIVEARPAQR